MPLVELVKAFIAAPIRIHLLAKAIEFLILPGALDFFTIWEGVDAKALHDAILVVAIVGLFVSPALDTKAIAFTVLEISNEQHTVRVSFLATSRLDASLPHTLVSEVVDVARNALAMVHIIGPFTFISLTLHMRELAVALSSTKVPCALIRSTVAELHLASTVTETAQPLTIVRGTRRLILVGARGEVLLKLSLISIK